MILISGGVRFSLSDSLQSQSRLIDLTAVKGKSALLEVYEVLHPDITDHYGSKLDTSKILEKVVKYFFDNKIDSAAKELKKISKYRKTDNVVQYWVDRLKQPQ